MRTLASLFARTPVAETQVLSATEARKLIFAGRAPRRLRVEGHLNLSNFPAITLPDYLSASSLDLSGCTDLRALPEELHVRRLTISGCTALTELPAGLRCYELTARNTRLTTLPSDLAVEYRLDLEGCAELTRLPAALKVGTLILRECVALTSLPEELDVCFLDIAGCTRLKQWPQRAAVRIGRLNARGCTQLQALPPWLSNLAQLDVSGCTNLSALPAHLSIRSWLDLAHSGITSLPEQLQGIQLRWRGVPIDDRIAFQPETITAPEVLAEQNAELRRVLLERMGYDAFLAAADAHVLDQDYDPGGGRRLLRVAMPDDEALVCLAVLCPSTGRQYLLRVPPTTRSCRQAAAWIAGFDNAADYQPLVET